MSRRARFAFFAALLVCAALGTAEAQSLPTTISLSGIVTHSLPRANGLLDTQLNYADCENDDRLSFALSLTNASSYALEAWAGVGCADAAVRNSRIQTQCWKVYAGIPMATNPVVSISVRSIVAGYTSLFDSTAVTTTNTPDAGAVVSLPPVVSAGPEACLQPNASDVVAGTHVTVFFLVIDPSTNFAVASATWDATFKLVGPPPPDTLSARVGSNHLAVDFSYATPFADQTLNGYNLYCDPPPGLAAAADAGLTPNDAGALGCDDRGSQALIPGQIAAPENICGTAPKTASSGEVKDLVNDVPYVVAIAAFDTYANIGPLSLLACAEPVPAATGQNVRACSFSARPAPLPAVALGLILPWVLLRRKRRSMRLRRVATAGAAERRRRVAAVGLRPGLGAD